MRRCPSTYEGDKSHFENCEFDRESGDDVQRRKKKKKKS